MTTVDESGWVRQLKHLLSEEQPAHNGLDVVAESSRDNALVFAERQPLRGNAFVGVTVLEPQPYEAVLVARPIESSYAIAKLKPKWSISDVPYVVIDPTPNAKPPVRSGEFLLWPDPRIVPEAEADLRNVAIANLVDRKFLLVLTSPASYALAVPHLLDFSLTVQATLQDDHSLKITGGTAVLTVGVYAQEDLQTVERNQQSWADSIRQAGYERRIWNFQPQNLRNVRASLDLPAGHAQGEIQSSSNTNIGTATFVVDLSEVGILSWKNALENGNASAIAGICRLTASYYGLAQDTVRVQDQELNVSLGTLLAGRGATDIQVINPQKTIAARLLVVGHELLDSAAISIRPNTGQAPEIRTFGKDGGEVGVSITTQNVEEIELPWSAQVTYKSTGWPVVPVSGTLSSKNGWTEILKPDAWISGYTLIAILVDAAGKPVPISTAGTDYHVNGVLTFTAPYIPVTGILVSPFDASNQVPINVALPRFPGQAAGDLVLNMFATRSGQAGTQTRRLNPTEAAVIIKIFPDASITITASSDLIPELSTDATFLEILRLLG